MSKRRVFFATMALLFLAAAVPAGTPEDTIPGHIAGHISIKSPSDLIGRLDEYAVNATAGTPNEVPPGLLSMLAAVYLPLPLDVWKADEEAHVIILPAEAGQDMPFVLAVRVESFDAFVDGLGEREWLVGEPGADEGMPLRPVVIPGGKAMVLADLGEGRAALSDTAAHIRTAIADGWSPAHQGDADLSVIFSMNRGEESLVEQSAAYITRKSDEIVAAISQNGIKPEVARGIAQMLAKYGPLVVAELEQIQALRVDLFVDADDIAIDTSALFAPGSLVREVADHVAGAPELDLDLARRFPRSATSVAVGLANEDLIPNARQRTIALNSDIYSLILPSFKDRLAAISDAYFHNGPGQSAAATFNHEGRQATVSIVKADDPEGMQRVFVDSLQELNNIWAASIDNPDLTARFAGELKNNGSQVYYAYQLYFPNDRGEAFQAFLDGIAAEHPEFRTALQMNLDFRLYLSQLDDGIVFAAGDMRDEEFVSLLSGLNQAAAEPLLDTVSARGILPLLQPAQITVSVMDADGLMRVMADALAREMDATTPEGKPNPYRVAAETMRFQDRGDVFGLAAGAENGWLTVRWLTPADAVNTVVRDYTAFERIRTRETERQLRELEQERQGRSSGGENGDGDGDGDEADPEEFDEIGAA